MALAGFEDFEIEDLAPPEEEEQAPAATEVASAVTLPPSLPAGAAAPVASLDPLFAPSVAPASVSLPPAATLAPAGGGAGLAAGGGGDYGWLEAAVAPEPEEGAADDAWADLDRELGLGDEEDGAAGAGAGDGDDAARGRRGRRRRGVGDVDSDDLGLDDDGDGDEGGGAARTPEPEKDRLDDMQVVDEEHMAKVQSVMASMDERQYERFAAFNGARLNTRPLKKLVTTLTGSDKVDPLLLLALGSITKAFVGELVEHARIIAARQGHKGALLPGHIRQAYALLEAERRTPHSRALRKPLR